MPINPSHQPEARRAFITVSVLTVMLVLITSILVSTTSPKISQFLSLYIALETLTLIIGGSIFALVWSSKHDRLSRNIIVLASVFLGVALLDFFQMLSYEGMPDFVTPSSAEKSIYFWLAARLLGTGALLAVAVLSWEKRGSARLFRLQLLLVLTGVAAVCVVYFRYGEWLPRTFIKGEGLAPFKLGFEYVLVALNLLAAALFIWRIQMPRRFNASGLFAAACIMAQSEFFFTLYTDVADAYTLIGHLYKVLAYAFLFHAVFIETVSYPYTQLRELQQRLQATLDALPDMVFELDAQGRHLSAHVPPHSGRLLPADQLLGLRVQDILTAEASATVMAAFSQASAVGVSRGKVIEWLIDGESHWFELSVACRRANPSSAERFVVISRDITDRLEKEQFLRTLSRAAEQSPIAFVVTDPQG